MKEAPQNINPKDRKPTRHPYFKITAGLATLALVGLAEGRRAEEAMKKYEKAREEAEGKARAAGMDKAEIADIGRRMVGESASAIYEAVQKDRAEEGKTEQ